MGVPRFTLRIWLPDRPGALGAVASRIGAVRGDLLGIDILERGGGRVIDELAVELPSDELLALLVAEVSEVDGVDVEDVREAPEDLPDTRVMALQSAAALVACASARAVPETLLACGRGDFQADWAAVVDLEEGTTLVSSGDTPPGAWLAAFILGSRAVDAGRGEGPGDIAWTVMEACCAGLVFGRRSHSFRALERRQIVLLGQIAEHRWQELNSRSSRRVHPSAVG